MADLVPFKAGSSYVVAMDTAVIVPMLAYGTVAAVEGTLVGTSWEACQTEVKAWVP